MHQNVIYIGIIEPSDLLYEGLTNILLKHRPNLRFYRIDELEDCFRYIPHIGFDIIIINPSQIQNRKKVFNNIKKERPQIRWVGIMYSLINSETLNVFDDIVRIDEGSEEICKKIIRLSDIKNSHKAGPQQKTLTGREIDVLKFLSKGLSNKEIGEFLKISIHTVISHRKNITQKTGIKSQSGLTIYAISNNIISIDNL